MLMDYTIYVNSVPKFPKCSLIYLYSVQWPFKGRETVDITDRLLLNPEILVSEATRNSLIDWKVNIFLEEHAPRTP